MAYKYTTGSVNRGDIYAESSIDDDGNTYINFGNNSIGLVAGAVDLLTVVSASQTKVHFNDGGVDCDFIVESPSQSLALYLHAENEVFHINHGESNFKTKIHSTHGEAMTVHQNGVVFNDDGHATNDLRVESDTNTHMIFVDASSNEVGIGTSSPNSVFHVSGSQAGNYAQIATSTATLDASHYIVDYTGNGNATITLPTVSGIAGRVYHAVKQNIPDGRIKKTAERGLSDYESIREKVRNIPT